MEVVVAEVHSWRKSRLHHHPPTNINRYARQQSYQQFLLRQVYKQFLRRLWHHPSLQEEEAEEAVATEVQSNPQTNIEVRQSKYVIQQLLINFFKLIISIVGEESSGHQNLSINSKRKDEKNFVAINCVCAHA